MIGEPPRTHTMPANVVFLGPKPNTDLPAYLAQADAAIIPFLPGPLTDAVSPVKVFEYLFLKKPVIATRMPELDGIPHVSQAATPEEFANLCGALPPAPDDLDLFISRNSWNCRIDGLIPRKAPQKRFSFIILIHNNRSIIGRCLRTLTDHSKGLNAEIIVVDNASTDGGDQIVAREFPHVRLLRNPKNGCSTGRNLGASAATGDCLVFLDSDQWFTGAAWLHEADHLLGHHPLIGGLSWNAGWFNPALDSLGGPTVDDLPQRGRNAEVERRGFRTDVTYLATSGMFVPRKVWEQCSGFDPYYDPHIFEDTDLSFQIRRAGFRIAYRDLGGIRHQPHQTTRADSRDAAYWSLFERNSAYFKNKWAEYLDDFSRAESM
jgi:GT2 family glycosyltransferase